MKNATLAKLLQVIAQFSTPARALVAQEPVPTTFIVRAGVHRGASLELSAAEYRVGADSDCDIVLSDAGAGTHVIRWDDAVSDYLVFASADHDESVEPQDVVQEGANVERRYLFGSVEVALAQPGELSEPLPPATVWRASTTQWIGGALLAGALFVVSMIPAENSEPAAIEPSEHSEKITHQQAADVLQQVRDALGSDEVQVRLDHGRVRVEGTTSKTALRKRLQLLSEELHGVVEIEDRVSYVESADVQPPMPISVRDVMVGNPGYFQTREGDRYYEGARLPDGAEVVAIEPDRIRFRLAGRDVVYGLD